MRKGNINMKTGLQLYTVRDFMAEDFFGTIEKVAKIGYKSVEFAGLFDHDPKEVKKFIDDLGLECSSCHVWGEDVNKSCDDVETLGSKNVVFNLGGMDTEEGFNKAFETFKNYAEITAKRGLKAVMHNHSHEHICRPFGKAFFEYVLENIPNLYSELDLGWTYAGYYNPVERVKAYNDKINLLHCKDSKIKTTSAWAGGTLVKTEMITQVPNGEGDVNIKGCIEVSKADYAIVELDMYDYCMWDAVEKSYNYLTKECGCEGNK